MEELLEQSDTIAKLAKAMLSASRSIAHPVKNATNPHFRSRYVDLTGVIDSIKEQYAEQGLVITQLVTGEYLTTMIMHESGEYIRSAAKISPDKQTVQAFGSALTYMRRYTLSALANIASDPDDDGNAATSQENKPAQTGEW